MRPTAPPLALPLVLGALLAGSSAGCASARAERDVGSLVREGRYAEALRRAEERLAESPGDENAQRVHRRARAAYLLDRGRTLVFDGRNEEALRIFLEAQTLAPDEPVVASWIEKTRLELANAWLVRAQGYSIEDLNAAQDAYERVLVYDPGNETAELGLARVLLLRNHRAGRSLEYYREGVQSFERLLLDVSQRAFGISDDLQTNEHARARQKEARRLLAEERVAQAEEFERQGQYFAAKTDYRLALLLVPGHEVARRGYDRMDREGRAVRKLGEAEMHRLRGDLEKAEEAVAQAVVLSQVQGDAISLEASKIEDAHFETLYQRALSLEQERQYEEAIEAYGELLARSEFYKDAIARKQTIEWIVAQAAELYAQALSATDDAEAYDYLSRIESLVWPDYEDVRERLRELEARGVGSEPGD